MNEVTVSIVVTGAGEATTCIESIKAQTLKDIEIIVDGDWTKARGKYIYVLDGKDMIFENALESMVAEAEPDAAIVHATAYVERRGEDVSVVKDQPSPDSPTDPKNFFASEGFHLSPSLNLYRKDFLERCQLDCRGGEAFSFAAFMLAAKVCFLEDYFYIKNISTPIESDDDPDCLVDRLKADEFRAGFLVTTQRKKLWNVQLHLIEEFARICRKHNLTWFAYAGTLLGAARHGGFVPWDDDVDLALLRPDYERLKAVISSELRAEYSVDFWYDYAFEGERNPEHLPTLSRAVFDSNAWWPSTASYFKIRDNRTSMIEWSDRPHVNQGICIDIFPLDPIPPFDDAQHQKHFKIVTEMMMAVSAPDSLAAALKSKDRLASDRKYLKALLKKPFRDRALAYEKYLADNWFESEYAGHINSIFAYRREYAWRREYWREAIELPFERITLPAPIDFDKVLTAHYGAWREPVITHSHPAVHSADVSYREYFEHIAPEIVGKRYL